MDPHQMQHSDPDSMQHPMMKRMLGAMSVATMLMTIPQVWVIWVDKEAAGVSLLSWTAYLVSAVLWFWHGLLRHDKNIYLACIGWIALDVGVILGVLLYG
jgi:uncharacterized protein with PQ loop repeat